MKPLLFLLVILMSPPLEAQTRVDQQEIDAAVAAELAGVALEGRLDVVLHDDGTATVTYARTDGRSISRTILLPPRHEDVVETVVLLASNLVRDQLDALPAEPAADTSIVATPPTVLTLPAPAPRLVPVGFGLLPFASTDLLYDGPVEHRFALHLIGGASGGVRGVSVGVAFDVQRGPVRGVQLAGAVNIASGEVRGAQLAGAVDVAAGDVAGAQLAGGASIAAGDVDGLQMSGALNVTSGALRGWQVAGGLNVAGVARGAQLAGGINVAGEAYGLQMAPVNVARRAHGLQLGVVNYADSSDGVSIGVISIVRHGITEVDALAESFGGLGVTLRHGTRRFYNLYGAATTLAARADSVQMSGLGFGSRLLTDEVLGAPVDVDLDVMGWAVVGEGIDAEVALLHRARLSAGLELGRITVFAGGALNVFVADDDEDGDMFHPALDTTWRKDDVTTRLWPSIYAGVRVR